MGYRILYRGNFLPQIEPESDRWSTECQVAWTLESMGHEVIRAQEFDPTAKDGRPAYTWADLTRTAAAGVDCFLWTQTYNVDPEGGFRFLDFLRRQGTPSASFHLDLYWGLERQAQIMEHPFWRTDYVFTADGGHDEGFRRNGVSHVWMPPCIYSPDALGGQPRETYARFPVCFTGSMPYPHASHAEARRNIVLALQARYGRLYRGYRSGVRRRDLTDLCASVTVMVGDSCHAGRVARYWSERIPECLGRAGFMVHPHVEGIESWYEDGKHLRLFEAGDIGQLYALVDHYLAHPAEARRIAQAGQELVLSRDCYEHRLAEVLRQVGLEQAARVA